ncbi:MAG: hypothetical protein ACYCY9_07585 [Thiobacillus sp.]
MSQQINLISPLLLKKRYAFGLREMGMGLGVALAGALVWAGVLHVQANELETEAMQKEALQADAQQQLDQLAAASTRPVSALLTERIKATQAQVAQHEALLAAIGGTVNSAASGFSPRMRALANGDTQGVWLNGLTLAPDYVALNGSALNADVLTTYIAQLGKQPPFAGMRFSGMNAERAQSGGEKTQAAALPEHMDFVLYSGSPDKPSGLGVSHGE